MELRRFGRKVRQQDVWLAMMGIGTLFLLLALPIIFGFGREFGESLAENGDLSDSFVPTIVVVGWLSIVAFGLVSGVASEGELYDHGAIQAIRPPKDVAGGLVVYVLAGYAPFVVLPGAAVGAGIAMGVGTPVAAVGVLLAAACILCSGAIVGYAIGLAFKGAIRRSPWLMALKPVLGIAVVVGYFWASFTGRLWPVLADAGSLLEATPVAWFVDLALVTAPGAAVSTQNALGALGLTLVLVPVGVLAVVRAGIYAWYVDEGRGDEGRVDEGRVDEGSVDEGGTANRADMGPVTREATTAEHLDRLLATVGVHPATRGVAVVVLLRGYRAPLALVYVAIPFLFLVPLVDSMVRTGAVPAWFPWMVICYGAWAAGVSFPLNILGNQGSTLPRLLTSPATGRRIVHGYVLATALVFAPVTVALGALTAHMAARPPAIVVAVAVAGSVLVVAASVLAAGIGATLPRFKTVDLTGSTKAVLPSKIAFATFSVVAMLTANTVGMLADDLYQAAVLALVTEHAPFALTVPDGAFERLSVFVLAFGVLAVPVAYVHGAQLIDDYRVA